MRIILILLGVYFIIIGGLLMILTDATMEILRGIIKKRNMRFLSILTLALGIALLYGTSIVSVPWFTIILGLLAIAKGLFFMFGPEKKTKPLLDWWLNASNNICRSWGLVSFLIGILLLLIL
jgi:uncharacterized protein YjeT (DUF2065 family)